LYSAAQVRELDRRAIGDLGIPGYVLMQRAAAAAFAALRRQWPQARRVAVLCGSGNNGGDGYEIARLAFEAGLDVEVARVGSLPSAGDAVAAHASWAGQGGAVRVYDAAFAADALASADVICDAIFGIGLTREVNGVPAEAIAAMNARGRGQGVLAVDVPSGLDADTGAVLGTAVRADVSVSFIGRKLGLYVGAGPDHAGRRAFADLGVPASLVDTSPAQCDLMCEDALADALPRRARSAHKGTHGHVLLVGGDLGMPGAILLAARAALRAGAGLVSVATRPAHALALTGAQPEVMFHGMDNAAGVDELIRRADVVALGPGLGTGVWSAGLFDRCVRAGKPLALDADALNLLARAAATRVPAGTVITPHPGEAARLLGIEGREVQADRLAAARALRTRHAGTVVVLKGAGSVVHGERTAICPYGNPGMGVGGMGDVLTGVIAALIGQGLDAERAASTGVLAHALAGDRASAAGGGERGLLPSDLIDQLRTVLNP
jgi:NAD(P)H-hydrate epimerase